MIGVEEAVEEARKQSARSREWVESRAECPFLFGRGGEMKVK